MALKNISIYVFDHFGRKTSMAQGRRKTFFPAKPNFRTYGKFSVVSKTISYRSVGQTVQKLQLIVIWRPFGHLLTLKTLIFGKLHIF